MSRNPFPGSYRIEVATIGGENPHHIIEATTLERAEAEFAQEVESWVDRGQIVTLIGPDNNVLRRVIT